MRKASEPVDVQVHGAGWIGCWIAAELVAAGVRVRLVDRVRRAASGVAAGIVLGAHPEHPWRFEAALGTDRAAELVAFLRASVARAPGLDRVGVDWVCAGAEAEDGARSLAACARIGLPVEGTADGFRLLDAGRARPSGPVLPVFPDPVVAELDVWTGGAGGGEAWLADKLTPVRWQRAAVPGLELARPRVSRHGSVFADAGVIFGARWATPHLEVGEEDPTATPRVQAVLDRLARQDFGLPAGAGAAGIVAESCDGLPIVGPIPGRPRTIVCAGFGIAGLSWGPGAAATVVDGILGRDGLPLPAALATHRFR